VALGGEAAARGTFPQPIHGHYALDEVQTASWRDIELSDDGILRKRPLWLDLSGIAKGFAVDLGLAALRAAGVTQGTVNIGGDLAVFGPDSEAVHLRNDSDALPPEIEIENAAIASSGGAPAWAKTRHFHGRSREALSPHGFASVIAPDCITADALTKVMLASATVDLSLLARYSARTICYDAANDWQIFGGHDG